MAIYKHYNHHDDHPMEDLHFLFFQHCMKGLCHLFSRTLLTFLQHRSEEPDH